MIATEFLAHLVRLGVQFRVEGDQLTIRAPKEVLTPAERDTLSQHKQQIIALLREYSGEALSLYPLSQGQKALWFLYQLAPESPAYNIMAALRVNSTLDIPALQYAFQVLLQRHPCLRTTYTFIGGEPAQLVHNRVDLPFEVTDASNWSTDEFNDVMVQEADRPFDLEQGPVLRLKLFRRPAQEYVLLLVVHHIAFDFWSFEILLNELTRLYTAKQQQSEVTLPPLALQYSDYIRWQTELLASSKGEQLWAFWQKQLAGEVPVLNLPTDRPRQPVQTYNGASSPPFTLAAATVQRLKALGQAERATLYTILLAAFQVLLHRYSAQEDILVGSPMAGRSQVEFDGIIGNFVNPVVMRGDLSGQPTFKTFLGRIRQTVLAALEHADYPFLRLVEQLQPVRDPSRTPLFQVSFVWDKSGLSGASKATAVTLGETRAPLDAAGLELEPVAGGHRGAEVDLILMVYEQEDSLSACWRYNTDLFDTATIARMTGHFQTLLAGIAANPEQRLLELPLLTPAEREQLLMDWNKTQAAYPGDQGIHSLFEWQAEQTPAAVAAVYAAESLSYRELNQRANQLAHQLQRWGVGPGSRVGIYLERGLEMLVSVLGVLKAGAAYLPLDPAYPSERLAFMLDDAEAAVVLTQAKLAGQVTGVPARVVHLDQEWETIARQPAENPASGAGGDDPAYVIYTSGSTGKPKGVQLRHRGVVNFLNSMRHEPGLGQGDTLLAVTTLSFDIAVLELLLPLVAGGRVVVAGPDVVADGHRLARLLVESGATVMQATPATWRLLIEAGWEGSEKLKVLCGGEALSPELANQLLKRSSSVWNLYGPTETTIWSTVYRVEAGTGPVPIGRPIANTEIYILDENLQPVPVGVPGELYIGGAGVAAGYLKRPELNQEKFIAHPFKEGPARLYRTGDLARYLADGNLEFLGRIDHQVKLRGFRIELGEIEAVLEGHPAIQQAVVVPWQDGAVDERLVAYLVPEGEAEPGVSDLRRFLKEKLPDYMVPSTFVKLEALPLTPNGKVNRRALPAPDGARPDLEATYTAPQSEVEQTLARLWQEALKVDRVGIHDNFFDLGGHSLLLTQIHAKLRESFQTDLSIVKLFQYPTISALAKYLSQNGDSDKTVMQPIRPRVEKHDGPKGIAIIGMAGRFPGARNIDEFWQNLANGVESISFFSDAELQAAGVDPAVLNNPNYVKARGVLDDVELFDAAFFDFNPREAEITDPQHRLFLECAWEALEHAGYDPDTYPGLIGVYAGASMNTYLSNNLGLGLDPLAVVNSYQLMLGNDKDFMATRVSYKLNLKGPSVSVQTACSTSLVAVHLACQSLLNDPAMTMALAGGVSVATPRKAGYLYQEGMILSPDGHCRAFDAAAQGTVSGEGVGLVVLKRLTDALSDGDTIYAVIKGSAINNDGSLKVGYTAPSVEGQAQVIATAQAIAEVEPETISYVETHGTATPLGDPVEIAALARVFATDQARPGTCALGSVKTNIGHLDAAAGVAGLIKTTLALHHRQLPPSLHFQSANPKIDFAHSPFFVLQQLTPWLTGPHPRRAGVSSFGIGGTNAHLVLEQAPARPASPPGRPYHLLTLSARSDTALAQAADRLAAFLQHHDTANLADVAYTLQLGRHAFEHRRMLVCADRQEAIDSLQNPTLHHSGHFSGRQPEVVFLFSGQGSQYPGMGQGLYQTEPLFRQELDRCAALLQPELGLDLRTVLFPTEAQAAEAQARLDQTGLTQPALFALEYALARLWLAWGVQPRAMLGHSLGEYVAACLAGVFSLEDGLRLVAARARLMQQLPPGAMLAIALPQAEVVPLLDPDLSLAAVNGPGLCVVAGPIEAIDRLQATLTAQEITARRLHTSHAFHSAMMDPILEPFRAELSRVKLNPPRLPYLSNLTGQWLRPAEATNPDYWLNHLRQTVRFEAGLAELFAQPGRLLLEIGPGQTLTSLARQHPARSTAAALLASLRPVHDPTPDLAFLLKTAGRLWLSGLTLDWPAFYQDQQRQRLALPTYPFDRQRFWIEPARPDRQSKPAARSLAKNPNLAHWFYLPSWKRQTLPVSRQNNQPDSRLCWLVFIDAAGLGAGLVDRLTAAGHQTITVKPGPHFNPTGPTSFSLNPHHPADYDALLAHLDTTGSWPDHIVHLWSASPQPTPLDLAALDDAQSLGFYSLLFLAQAIGNRPGSRPIRLQVVSTFLHDVTGDEPLAPLKTTLLGPCRVIPQEFPHLRCQTIDLAWPAPDLLPRLLDQLWAELLAPSPEPVVAYRGSYRWVQHFEPTPLPPPPPTPHLRPGGVYLITGGLGGLGLALADYLARTLKAKLVLTNRSGLPNPADWPAWLASHDPADPTSRKIRQVQALEALGAEVLVGQADVANLAQMRHLLDLARTRFGPLHGVIHAAGVAGGGMIQLKTPETVEEVFSAKVKGTLVLDTLLSDTQLDFFVLCSSLNSILAAFGQVDYAGANAFLDAFAYYRKAKKGTRVVAINWDTWQEVGMAVNTAVPSHLEKWKEENLKHGLSIQEGQAAFERILGNSWPQVLLSTRDLDLLIEQTTDFKALNALNELEPQPSAAVEHPAEVHHSLHSRPALQSAYTAPRNELEQMIASIWQELLGIDQVGIHDNFFDLGGSSLIALRLFDQIEKSLDKRLPLTTLFSAPTVEQLAQILDHKDYTVSWSSLVPIQPNGTRPPFFCMHAAGGNVFVYRDLARHLGPDQPFYGLKTPALEGNQLLLTRIEDMAALYVKEIQTLQPDGPYLIAGYCMGGTIAFEVAQQLRAQGKEVALLALFETYNWRNIEVNSRREVVHHQLQRVGYHWRNFMLLDSKNKMTFLVEKMKVVRRRSRVWYGMIMGRFSQQANSNEKVLRPAQIWKANDDAAIAYIPQVYPGRITHFRPMKDYALYRGPRLGWDDLAAEGVETHIMPVYPAAMLVEPFVERLAEKLKVCIDKALTTKVKSHFGKNGRQEEVDGDKILFPG